MSALEASWVLLKADAYTRAWGREESPKWYNEAPPPVQRAGLQWPPSPPQAQMAELAGEQGRRHGVNRTLQQRLRNMPNVRDIGVMARDNLGATYRNVTGSRQQRTVTPAEYGEYRDWRARRKRGGYYRSGRTWNQFRYGEPDGEETRGTYSRPYVEGD